MEAIVIPLTLFLMIFGIVAVSIWGGVQNRRELNETMRRAIESGQQLDPDTIGSIMKPARPANADLRGGVVLISLSVGFIFAGFMAAGYLPGLKGWDEEAGTGFFVAAAIVGAIGIGQLLSGLIRREKKG